MLKGTGPYKGLIKGTSYSGQIPSSAAMPLRRLAGLAAAPDAILFIVYCSDWSASSEWRLGDWQLRWPWVNLFQQKGNYGMGLLP